MRHVHLEVIEKSPAAGDLAEESPAGGVIHLVLLEVLGQKIDLFGENGDLNMGRTCVFLVGLVLRDQSFLGCALEGHTLGGYRQKKFAPRLSPGKSG